MFRVKFNLNRVFTTTKTDKKKVTQRIPGKAIEIINKYSDFLSITDNLTVKYILTLLTPDEQMIRVVADLINYASRVF